MFNLQWEFINLEYGCKNKVILKSALFQPLPVFPNTALEDEMVDISQFAPTLYLNVFISPVP